MAGEAARFQPYATKYHTTTTQLAEIASKAKPRLLIISHASIVLRPGLRPQASSPEQVLKEVQSGYRGEVVVAILHIFSFSALDNIPVIRSTVQ